MTSDLNSCWHRQAIIVDEMNRFYDQFIKGHDLTCHMKGITKLLEATDKKGAELIDLGCGTAMLSDFCQEFNYIGADLPHVISGCAMRNYPDFLYRAVNVETDDLSWINKYPVVVANGLIDVMQYPMEVIKKILEHTQEYLVIHRQEITETGQTRVEERGSYGGYTWHSIINRQDLLIMLDGLNFDIVRQEQLQIGNWENGGHSFLLRRRRSWALHKIDHQLYTKYFLGKENGFFIEAGANDGLRQSNTMFFEFYKNWRGILIEPIPPVMELCKKNRSPKNIYCEVALVEPDPFMENYFEMYFTPDNYGLLSIVINEKTDELMKRIGGEKAVLVKAQPATLNEILETEAAERYIPKEIDLMVLDIEGGELNALKGIDFEKYRINYLLIEELNGGGEIAEYLAPWYERVDLFGEHDVLYCRK